MNPILSCLSHLKKPPSPALFHSAQARCHEIDTAKNKNAQRQDIHTILETFFLLLSHTNTHAPPSPPPSSLTLCETCHFFLKDNSTYYITIFLYRIHSPFIIPFFHASLHVNASCISADILKGESLTARRPVVRALGGGLSDAASRQSNEVLPVPPPAPGGILPAPGPPPPWGRVVHLAGECATPHRRRTPLVKSSWYVFDGGVAWYPLPPFCLRLIRSESCGRYDDSKFALPARLRKVGRSCINSSSCAAPRTAPLPFRITAST